jgi:hypothetical protein
MAPKDISLISNLEKIFGDLTKQKYQTTASLLGDIPSPLDFDTCHGCRKMDTKGILHISRYFPAD